MRGEFVSLSMWARASRWRCEQRLTRALCDGAGAGPGAWHANRFALCGIGHGEVGVSAKRKTQNPIN